MQPILISIGGLNIPSYTALLNLGIVLGLAVTYFEGKRSLHDGQMVLDLGLWTVLGAIIGGRIGFVLANLSAFSEDWSRALRIWEGGLAFPGAVLGGAFTVFLFAQIQQRRGVGVSICRLCDLLTPGLALGLIFGWAACLMAGCAFGITGMGPGYTFLPDIRGVGASRFATQAAGMALSLVLFLLVWLLRGRWAFHGAAFWTFALLYFSGHLFLEATRGDEAIYLGPLRLPQLLDLAWVLGSATVLMVLWWRARTRDQSGTGLPEIPREHGMNRL